MQAVGAARTTVLHRALDEVYHFRVATVMTATKTPLMATDTGKAHFKNETTLSTRKAESFASFIEASIDLRDSNATSKSPRMAETSPARD